MSNTKRPQVEIHTDGSFRGTPRVGGYAGVMISGPHAMTVVGRDSEARDNDQMELRAVISCLSQINTPAKIQLTSDSNYVVKGINTWLKGWKNNDWTTQKGTPVANQEMWKQVDEFKGVHSIKATWTKGHPKNPTTHEEIANQACDELAQMAAKGEIKL